MYLVIRSPKGGHTLITQLKKGALELCVLCLLSGGDKYGYELVATISEDIAVSEGTIYPLLKRIREENFVRTYIQESNEGPPRRYYALTDEGHQHTEALLAQWRAFSQAVDRLIEEGQHG